MKLRVRYFFDTFFSSHWQQTGFHCYDATPGRLEKHQRPLQIQTGRNNSSDASDVKEEGGSRTGLLIRPQTFTRRCAHTHTSAGLVQLCIQMKLLLYLHVKPDYISSGVFFGGVQEGCFYVFSPSVHSSRLRLFRLCCFFSVVFDEECIIQKRSTILSFKNRRNIFLIDGATFQTGQTGFYRE